MKLKLINAVGVAALVASTFAIAEHPGASSRGAATPPPRGNMATAGARLTVNIAKNPQSQGLVNARERVADNSIKHADNGPARVERPERPERALSPRLTDRPSHAAFGDRPLSPGLASADRPLPRGLATRDRPLPPGHARR
jgi:hypothetical protein